MNSFDKSSLKDQDYIDLNTAIRHAGPRVRYWYSAPNFFGPVNVGRIIEQTKATSDFDSLKGEYDWLTEYDSKSQRIHVSKRGGWKSLLGFRDIEFRIYNPENFLPSINVLGRTADLVQIEALNFGNIFKGKIDFEDGSAFFNEEDQDIAHRLGFMYAPGKVLETDPLSPSSPSTNQGRVEKDGEVKLYCDNTACREEIRNPVLVVDECTKGVYHSNICFMKDIRLKCYLSEENPDLEFTPSPKEISLENAVEMFANNKLQQSPGFKEAFPKFRHLKPWPEGATVTLLQ